MGIVLRIEGNQQEWWGNGSDQWTDVIDFGTLSKMVVCNKQGRTHEKLKTLYLLQIVVMKETMINMFL